MIQITNEDNMELMARYPDKHFQLAIVDPPYFNGPEKLGYYGKSVSSTGVERGYNDIGSWNVPTEHYLKELQRVSEHQIIWGINYMPFIHTPGRIVWDKCNEISSFSDCEIASCTKHTSVKKFTFMWNGMLQGKSILEGHVMQGNKKLNEKRIHPTQKPVALYKWLLHNYANPGDKILDTFLGSGSIAIACHNLGFDLTACELDKDYYEAAMKRLKQHQAQLTIF